MGARELAVTAAVIGGVMYGVAVALSPDPPVRWAAIVMGFASAMWAINALIEYRRSRPRLRTEVRREFVPSAWREPHTTSRISSH